MLWNTKKFAQEKLSLRVLRHTSPILNPLIQEQIKQRVMLATKNRVMNETRSATFSASRLGFIKLIATSAFGILAIFGTAYASTAANPGDILYPVKRAQETVRLSLAASEETKATLQASFAQERIQEVKNIKKFSKPQNLLKTKPKLDNDAQDSAEKEIKNTLQNLEAAEAHLKAQGKIEAALQVRKNIKSIKQEAKKQELIEEIKDN